MLDKLRPTAAGLDSILAWFLRPGAPVFVAIQSDDCRRLYTTAMEDGDYHTGAEDQQTDTAD